jgi:glutathione S-transferase
MIELWQAEWCPHSHKVRQRLTETGVDFIVHQVPAEPAERHELEAHAGTQSIPTLRTDDGAVLTGEEEILPWLAGRFADRPDAAMHRAKARAEVPDFAELHS